MFTMVLNINSDLDAVAIQKYFTALVREEGKTEISQVAFIFGSGQDVSQ